MSFLYLLGIFLFCSRNNSIIVSNLSQQSVTLINSSHKHIHQLIIGIKPNKNHNTSLLPLRLAMLAQINAIGSVKIINGRKLSKGFGVFILVPLYFCQFLIPFFFSIQSGKLLYLVLEIEDDIEFILGLEAYPFSVQETCVQERSQIIFNKFY